jgi:hypothetical protein
MDHRSAIQAQFSPFRKAILVEHSLASPALYHFIPKSSRLVIALLFKLHPSTLARMAPRLSSWDRLGLLLKLLFFLLLLRRALLRKALPRAHIAFGNRSHWTLDLHDLLSGG